MHTLTHKLRIMSYDFCTLLFWRFPKIPHDFSQDVELRGTGKIRKCKRTFCMTKLEVLGRVRGDSQKQESI